MIIRGSPIYDEAVSGLAAHWLVRSEKRDLGAETRGGAAIPVEERQFDGQPHQWHEQRARFFGPVAFLRERLQVGANSLAPAATTQVERYERRRKMTAVGSMASRSAAVVLACISANAVRNILERVAAPISPRRARAAGRFTVASRTPAKVFRRGDLAGGRTTVNSVKNNDQQKELTFS